MKRGLVLIALSGLAVGASAQTFSENFDSVSGGLPGAGWFSQNNSSPAPSGAFAGATPWFNGNVALFAGQSGGYISTNYQRTADENTSGDLSVWLLTPQLTWVNGDTISFYTRTIAGAAFPDRLEVRLGANGSTTDVGGTSSSVGTYTNVLLTVNPTLVAGSSGYPDVWTQYSLTLGGLSGAVSSRLAFRYFVTNGGATGANSSTIGLDTLRITNAVPEPASMAALGFGALGLMARRRRK
jgi:hypothetical protein